MSEYGVKTETTHSSYTVGTGEVPPTWTDYRDVSKYVARIIADSRTLNQKIFAYTDLRTLHELYGMVEQVEQKYRTIDEIEDGIAASKDDPNKMIDYCSYTYQKSYDIMGERTPEYASYLGYQIGKDLYPDMERISFEDFF
ncbi:hypothetical protein FPOAC2_03867 [Fusarium poae]